MGQPARHISGRISWRRLGVSAAAWVLLLTMCPLAWCGVFTPLATIWSFGSYGVNTRVLAIYDSSLFTGISEIDIQQIAFYSQFLFRVY